MIGVADDQAGAGAEDRPAGLVVGTQRRLQPRGLDPLADRRALAAGDHQRVEALEIGRRADLRGFGAEPAPGVSRRASKPPCSASTPTWRVCVIAQRARLARAGPSGARTQGGQIAQCYLADRGRRTAPCPPPDVRPRQGRHEGVGDHCHRDGGQSDREDDQTRDRRPVVFEVSQRRVIRGVEQHRRHEQRECEFRGQRERRRRWNKSQRCTSDGEEHRIGCTSAPGSSRQDHRRHEQNEQLFEFAHRRADPEGIASRLSGRPDAAGAPGNERHAR